MAPETTRARRLGTTRKLVAGLGLVVLGAVLAPATAGADTPVSEIGLGPGFAHTCARLPSQASRVDAILAIIEGGPRARGSVAWIEVQIDTALAPGHTQAAAALQQHLAVRQAKLALMEDRHDVLADLAELCAD